MAGVQTCFRRLKPYVGFFKWCVALALLGYLFYENIYRNRDALGQIALGTETDEYEIGEQML